MACEDVQSWIERGSCSPVCICKYSSSLFPLCVAVLCVSVSIDAHSFVSASVCAHVSMTLQDIDLAKHFAFPFMCCSRVCVSVSIDAYSFVSGAVCAHVSTTLQDTDLAKHFVLFFMCCSCMHL